MVHRRHARDHALAERRGPFPPGNDAVLRSGEAFSRRDDFVDMCVRIEIADQVRPLVGADQGHRTGALAHSQTVDGGDGQASLLDALQASLDRLRQAVAGLIERIFTIAERAAARDADEDRGRHDGAVRPEGFGANAGQRRPTAIPASAHNRPCTTSDRAANCAAISAGTLLSNACGCGAPITCGASATITAPSRMMGLSIRRNAHSANAVAIAVPIHQAWRAINSPAPLPGSSGARPAAGARPVATKPAIAQASERRSSIGSPAKIMPASSRKEIPTAVPTVVMLV